MTRRTLVAIAVAGSAGLLAAAFAFQYLGGLAPCKLCIWQRWPHAVAVAIGLLALALASPGRLLPAAGALAVAVAAGLGVYHTGVERGWWQGPDTCTSGAIGGLSPADLLAQIEAAPIVRCDEVPWEMLGLSMASWQAVAATALALVWLAALRRA